MYQLIGNTQITSLKSSLLFFVLLWKKRGLHILISIKSLSQAYHFNFSHLCLFISCVFTFIKINKCWQNIKSLLRVSLIIHNEHICEQCQPANTQNLYGLTGNYFLVQCPLLCVSDAIKEPQEFSQPQACVTSLFSRLACRTESPDLE